MSSQSGIRRSENDAGYSAPKSDNAYRTSLSPRNLQDIPERRIIEEDDWHSPSSPDFHRRYDVGRYYYPLTGENGPRFVGSVSSLASVPLQSQQFARSSHAPSLLDSGSSAYSDSLPHTSEGEIAIEENQRFLDVDDDGIARVPETGWPCPYPFLGCHKMLSGVADWHRHCQSHFYRRDGRLVLPRNVDCPFRCDWACSGTSAEQAWGERCRHILSQHPSGGQLSQSPVIRPLIQHMWESGILSPIELQDLITYGRVQPSPAQPYLQQSRSSQGRRRERGTATGAAIPRHRGQN